MSLAADRVVVEEVGLADLPAVPSGGRVRRHIVKMIEKSQITSTPTTGLGGGAHPDPGPAQHPPAGPEGGTPRSSLRSRRRRRRRPKRRPEPARRPAPAAAPAASTLESGLPRRCPRRPIESSAILVHQHEAGGCRRRASTLCRLAVADICTSWCCPLTMSSLNTMSLHKARHGASDDDTDRQSMTNIHVSRGWERGDRSFVPSSSRLTTSPPPNPRPIYVSPNLAGRMASSSTSSRCTRSRGPIRPTRPCSRTSR